MPQGGAPDPAAGYRSAAPGVRSWSLDDLDTLRGGFRCFFDGDDEAGGGEAQQRFRSAGQLPVGERKRGSGGRVGVDLVRAKVAHHPGRGQRETIGGTLALRFAWPACDITPAPTTASARIGDALAGGSDLTIQSW